MCLRQSFHPRYIHRVICIEDDACILKLRLPLLHRRRLSYISDWCRYVGSHASLQRRESCAVCDASFKSATATGYSSWIFDDVAISPVFVDISSVILGARFAFSHVPITSLVSSFPATICGSFASAARGGTTANHLCFDTVLNRPKQNQGYWVELNLGLGFQIDLIFKFRSYSIIIVRMWCSEITFCVKLSPVSMIFRYLERSRYFILMMYYKCFNLISSNFVIWSYQTYFISALTSI